MPLPSITKKIRRSREHKEHKERMTIGQYLLKRLEKLGLTHIFGDIHCQSERFVKLAKQHEHIEWIGTLFSSSIADGFARGKYDTIKNFSVVIVPQSDLQKESATIIRAVQESVPLAFIVTTKDLPKKNNDFLHDFHFQTASQEIHSSFKKFIKKCFFSYSVLDDAAVAAKKIDQVLDSCIHYQKPVCLELPEKMVDAFIPRHQAKRTFFPPSDPESLRDAFLHIRKIIESAKRPYICIGRDVGVLKVSDILLNLAEKVNIPIISTPIGKAVIDEEHPLFFGTFGVTEKIVKEGDVALFFGVDTIKKTAATHAAYIFDQDMIVDSVCYPQVALRDLVEQLARSTFQEKKSWYFSLEKWAPYSSDSRAINGGKLNLQRLVGRLLPFLYDDVTVITHHPDVMKEFSNHRLPKDSFLTGSFDVLPVAIGVALAAPTRRPLVILDEAELLKNIGLLSSCGNVQVSPIIIVLTKETDGNSHLNSIRVKTESDFENAMKKALRHHDGYFLITSAINY